MESVRVANGAGHAVVSGARVECVRLLGFHLCEREPVQVNSLDLA